ncbi:MAG: glycosyltransferase family 2 protein, partial [Candidatus Altiarchaeales archaeon]|nr:glycosyltransferase family 2 protein [Candidatus Altiarchaeales archaeon]
AYNEEKFVGGVIDTMPEFVDRIIIVDDASTDSTCKVVKSHTDSRMVLIKHENNQGVGAAIVTGYKKVFADSIDIAVVMAGDGQMSPDEMTKLLDPIVEKKTDYVKGNRLLAKDIIKKFPMLRLVGNAILTILTKISSGYWHIMDPQNGYTAVSRSVLERLDLESIYPGYGYCNDILVKLNVYNFRVMDVPTTPIYGNEKSGIRMLKYSITLSTLLLTRFFWRLWEKYVVLNFHPLILFYFMGMILSFLGMLIGLDILYHRIIIGAIAATSVVLCSLLLITGFQFLLFAMLFDMQYNESLRGG